MILVIEHSPERAALIYQRLPEEEQTNSMWVNTVAEAIDVLRSAYYWHITKIYMHHNLADEEYTDTRRADSGMEIVRFIETCGSSHIEVICHGHHPIAARMAERLNKAGWKAYHKPFGE